MAAASATTTARANKQITIPCGITHTRRRSTILSQVSTVVEASGKIGARLRHGACPVRTAARVLTHPMKKNPERLRRAVFFHRQTLASVQPQPHSVARFRRRALVGRFIGRRGGSLHCASAPGGGGVPPRSPPPPPPRAQSCCGSGRPCAFGSGCYPVRMLSMNSPPLASHVLLLLRSLRSLYPGFARSDTNAASPLRARVDHNPNYI